MGKILGPPPQSSYFRCSTLVPPPLPTFLEGPCCSKLSCLAVAQSTAGSVKERRKFRELLSSPAEIQGPVTSPALGVGKNPYMGLLASKGTRGNPSRWWPLWHPPLRTKLKALGHQLQKKRKSSWASKWASFAYSMDSCIEEPGLQRPRASALEPCLLWGGTSAQGILLLP